MGTASSTITPQSKLPIISNNKQLAKMMEHFIDSYSISVERLFSFSRSNTQKQCVQYYKLRLPQHRILNANYVEKCQNPSRKLHFLLQYFTQQPISNPQLDRLKGVIHIQNMLKFIYPGESQQRHNVLLQQFQMLDKYNQRVTQRVEITLQWYRKKQYPYILLCQVMHNLRDFNELYLVRIPFRDLFKSIRSQYQLLKKQWQYKSQMRQIVAYKPCFIKEIDYLNLKGNQGKTFQLFQFFSARVTRDEEEAIRLIKYQKPKYQHSDMIPALLRILIPDEQRADDNDFGYCFADKITRRQIIINILNTFKIRKVRKVITDGKQVIRIDLQYGPTPNLLHRFRQNRQVNKQSGKNKDTLIIFQVQEQRQDDDDQMKIQREVSSVIVEYVRQKPSKIQRKDLIRENLEKKKYSPAQEDQTLLNYYFMQVEQFRKVEDQGTLLALLGQSQNAISFYDRKLSKLHSQYQRAQALNKSGLVQLRRYKFREALILFDQAMKTLLKQRHNNLLQIIASKYNKSICLQQLNKLDDAYNYHKKVVEQIDKQSFRKIFGENYKLHMIYKIGLANCLRKMGKPVISKSILEKIAPVLQKIDEDPQCMGDFLDALGLTLMDIPGQNSIDSAVNCFRKSLQIYKNSQTNLKIGVCLGYLGQAERRRQDYDQAQKLCVKSLQYINKVDNTQIHASKVQKIRGQISKNVLEYRQAIKYFARAIKLKQQVFGTDSPFLAQLYAQIGLCCRLGKYYQDARKNYKIAMSLLPKQNPLYKIYQNQLFEKCMPSY